jgi:lipoprotein-anchoring transpeptidase ErfK/SrfK
MPRRLRLAVYSGALAIGLAAPAVWLATDASGKHPVSVSSTTARQTPVGQPDVTSRSSVTREHTATPATPPTSASALAPSASQTISSPTDVPAQTLVATIPAAGAPGSQTPGGPSTLQVPGQWLGAASILPVIAEQPGWYEVRLAQRPNESVAWVSARDLRLATDSYHVVINLDTKHLQLFNDGQELASFPAGIGVPADPTPTGSFFVALFAQSPSPGYGQFVIVTSAHSDAISDWEASGDAITAIHGSLGADAAIGTTGAQVSHGCVRLHDGDLAQLRGVPAGTPVDIVS